MQFDLALAAGVSRSAGSRPNSSLPTLLNVLPGGSQSLGLFGADLQAAQSERERRREADAQELAAGHAGSSRPTEIIAEDERNMRPGSRTFRREQVRDQARETAQQERDATRDAARKPSESGRESLKSAANRTASEAPAKPSSSPAPATPAANTEPVAKALAAPTDKTAPASTPAQRAASGALRPAAALPSGPSVSTGPAASAVARSANAAERVSTLGTAAATARPVTAVTSARGAGNSVATVAPARGGQTATRATTTRAAAEAPPEESNTDANIERMLRTIHARIGKERSVATLRLDPAELGMVRLRMDLRNDQLTLLIETESPQARRVLGEQLDTLRKSLESAGIQLERVELHTVEAAPSSPDAQDPRDADGGTGQHDPSARSDDGSAGGRERSTADAFLDEPVPDLARDVTLEPAAESLVNVLA